MISESQLKRLRINCRNDSDKLYKEIDKNQIKIHLLNYILGE